MVLPSPSPAKPQPAPRALPVGTNTLALTPPRTRSDAWVAAQFPVQANYTRVFAVGAPAGTKIARVPRLDLNARVGQLTYEELAITDTVPSLQAAADRVVGGDLVVAFPGTYAGFHLEHPKGTGPGKFVRFVALGEKGEVVINRAPDADHGSWMVALVNVDHVILEGFELRGSSKPGQPAENTPRAGIFIDGYFRESARMAHHVAILRVLSHHHKNWGLHSTDTQDVLIQDSVFGYSGTEHGCYVSDGSDRYVIRRNVFVNNPASGLQCNLDPTASYEELVEHPKMLRGVDATRAWIAKTATDATKLFGPGAFPDGRGMEFIIEDNVATGNGRVGGAAMNLAGVSQSVIQNNLIYGNFSTGIAQWDNGNPFDYDARDPGPRSVEHVPGPEVLPLFGCQQNLIRNNTVIMDNKSRPALQSVNGSWGTRVFNNVLINDSGSALEVDNTSIYRFEASHNIITRIEYSNGSEKLKALATAAPELNAQLDVEFSDIKSAFLRPGLDAWLTADLRSLSPNRPDFRPNRERSEVLLRVNPKEVEAFDLLGVERKPPLLGAFAY
ncbi:MAG: right-handed parallel beta-helix repeat-containing protein [Polyangiaceae bacterium]|nr:right-handed parallel beta-helix repeat-containing protein [Polyangiaceae bacterium]